MAVMCLSLRPTADTVILKGLTGAVSLRPYTFVDPGIAHRLNKFKNGPPKVAGVMPSIYA